MSLANGSFEGTYILKEFYKDEYAVRIDRETLEDDGRYYFTVDFESLADGGIDFIENWMSDGTKAGTLLPGERSLGDPWNTGWWLFFERFIRQHTLGRCHRKSLVFHSTKEYPRFQCT